MGDCQDEEDEDSSEDEDYVPGADKTAEAEDRANFAASGGQLILPKRKRHARIAAAAGNEKEEQEQDEEGAIMQEEEDTGSNALNPRLMAKRAKINQLWNLLNSKPEHAPPPPTQQDMSSAPESPSLPTPLAPGHKGKASTLAHGPGSAVSLAALCQSVDPKQRRTADTDVLWMRALGMPPPSSKAPAPAGPLSIARPFSLAGGPPTAGPGSSAVDQTGGQGAGSVASDSTAATGSESGVGRAPMSEAAKLAAGAALAAARESLGAGKHGKVTLTETRRFAGKDIQVTKTVDKNSKEVQQAAERQQPVKSGLDAFLAEVEKKRKVTVLDKTKADWNQLKAGDTSLEEELEAHKRSGAGYLDKVNFLKRAEVREYEKERDARLGADVRTRGRL